MILEMILSLGGTSFRIFRNPYRESLKGSFQVARICGGNIAFSCLHKVNKTQLSHLTSHNLEEPFTDSLYLYPGVDLVHWLVKVVLSHPF